MSETENSHSSYVVLCQMGESDSGTFGLIGPKAVPAPSAEAAIRRVAQERGAGTYVAIPVRSFRPVTVEVETQKVVKLA